jgi:hypothetical protein
MKAPGGLVTGSRFKIRHLRRLQNRNYDGETPKSQAPNPKENFKSQNPKPKQMPITKISMARQNSGVFLKLEI